MSLISKLKILINKKFPNNNFDFVVNNWLFILVVVIFLLMRLPLLDYPLGLTRQLVKEAYRSYTAVTYSAKITYSVYFEQPIYVLLLEVGYFLSGNSPEGMVLWGRTLGLIISFITLEIIYQISGTLFGKTAGIFSALLYSISPYGLFIGLGIQRENLMWLFGIVSLFFLLKYLKTYNKKFIWLNAIFGFLAILTKFTGIYFIFTSIIIYIFVYPNDRIEKKLNFKKFSVRIDLGFSFMRRIIIIGIFLVAIGIFSIVLAKSSYSAVQSSPLHHTIAVQPKALFDMSFYGNFLNDTMERLSLVIALLGCAGFFMAIFMFKKESSLVIVWTIFAGLEYAFYGYGTVIHHYYILYFLHPLAILGGYTISILYNGIKDKSTLEIFPKKYINALALISLVLIMGFFPTYRYSQELETANYARPLYEDIEEIGSLLRNCDYSGEEIAIVFNKTNYDWWKFKLVLVRTYIAKKNITVVYSTNITEFLLNNNLKAIIGWSDDLSPVNTTLESLFSYHLVFPQDFGIPSLELWHK